MAGSSPNGQKTLLEKEKLLVTSNFSFSHSVFRRFVLQTGKNQGLFGKGSKVNPLLNDKILHLSRFKGFADDTLTFFLLMMTQEAFVDSVD